MTNPTPEEMDEHYDQLNREIDKELDVRSQLPAASASLRPPKYQGQDGTMLPVVPERETMPTPLYVTNHPDRPQVVLRFKTQMEADRAWRILAAMCEAHADRTHKEQEDEASVSRREIPLLR